MWLLVFDRLDTGPATELLVVWVTGQAVASATLGGADVVVLIDLSFASGVALSVDLPPACQAVVSVASQADRPNIL